MGISLFSSGQFSHFFNLKNMASTNTKDFCERKNGPNFPDFFIFMYLADGGSPDFYISLQ
jgi:hypothetical protein